MTNNQIALAVLAFLLALLGFLIEREISQLDARLDRIIEYVVHEQLKAPPHDR